MLVKGTQDTASGSRGAFDHEPGNAGNTPGNAESGGGGSGGGRSDGSYGEVGNLTRELINTNLSDTPRLEEMVVTAIITIMCTKSNFQSSVRQLPQELGNIMSER